jgi:type VI secretion system protein ImpJ
MLITGPENSVTLTRTDDYGFSATIPLSTFKDAMSFYLLLRTTETIDRIETVMRDLVKIGSIESIAELITRSLPGLPARYVPMPPPGIPRRADTHCFMLDLHHEQWSEIQKNRSICVYWDSASPDTNLELLVMRS